MIFALFNGLVLKLNIPNSKDNPFPYFFLNVNKGWDVVIKWCLILSLIHIYVGKEAKEIAASGLSLEEYYGFEGGDYVD